MAARQWIPSPHGWTFESRFFSRNWDIRGTAPSLLSK